MKRSALRRRTGLVRRTSLRRRTGVRRSAPRPAVPVEVRVALGERSGGVCEMGVRLGGVCRGAASDVHHRRLLGMGGCSGEARERADRLSSVMHVCRACHRWAHAAPQRAELNGWILPRGSDSSVDPTWRRGVLVYLTDSGQVVDYEAVCT